MAGIKPLRYIQLGLETTKGTAVAATARWRGKGTIEDLRETVFVEEDIASLSGEDRTFQPFHFGGLAFDEVEATFEQLPYILAAGVKDVVTGAADGIGSGKIYQYTFPVTTPNSIKTYTIEGGDDQEGEEIEYGYVERFRVSGRAKEAVMMSADWKGRQVVVAAKTAALALPAVEEILFQKGKVYIDAVSGTIGTTQKSNTLLGFELEVVTGWVPRFSGDGNLFFTRHAFAMLPEVTLRVTFEHDGISAAEKVNWRAETPILLRVQIEGPTLATAGTTYTFMTLNIDLAGKWESFDKIDEDDGNDIVVGNFRAKNDPTASFFAELLVVNELASLP